MPKKISPIQTTVKPEFIAKIRSGGKVEVITVPKDIIEKFKLKRGKEYRIKFIEEL